MKTTIFTKAEMQTVYTQDGRAMMATGLYADNCFVTAVKNQEDHGYQSIQLGYGKKTKINQPLAGFLDKIKFKNFPKFFKEVPTGEDLPEIGQEIKFEEIFTEGDLITVTGISKGKGFAGAVKRWHFKGGPRTHGQSDRERAPGSSGPTTTPGKVHKGKRRAGRMGSDKVTVKNLKVLKIEPEKKLLWVQGAVPGIRGGYLIVTKNEKL